MIGYTDTELKDLVKLHEGVRLRPYKDTVGKWTIGIGRNLSDRGISKQEAEMMLENDLRDVAAQLEFYFPWMNQLSRNRQMAMIDMCFNLGIAKFREFKQMLMHMAMSDFEKAADAMFHSLWASQVKGRATTLADMVRKG